MPGLGLEFLDEVERTVHRKRKAISAIKNKTHFLAAAISLAALNDACGQSTNTSIYKALYVFGSSWADTQNGPYYLGHWSNGPMWPEYLSWEKGSGCKIKHTPV